MVFVKKGGDITSAGLTVATALNRRPVKGSVGLEIEVEGKNLPDEDITPEPWVYHTDGSLRGEENAEYVLASPIPFEEVDVALSKLWGVFDENKARLDESNRTSVHVHLNVQSFFLNRLTSFMAMYFTFEEILVEWCGEHRVGNLFCLRAKDAPAIISQIRRFIEADMKVPLRDHHHYAGMNANALHKFGSLEFRSLRGVSNPEIIKQWVGLLERLYHLSAEYEDPRQFCDLFSSEGPLSMFETILGEYAPIIRQGVSFTDDQIRESLYEGIRMAQDLCYSREWSEFKPMKLEPDPFGRSAAKVLQGLAQQSAPGTTAPMPGSNPASLTFTQAIYTDYPEVSEWDIPQEIYDNHWEEG